MSQQPQQRGSRGPRVVLAVVAAAVIALCAWSMSQYAQGSDPLAWITSQPALQTTQNAASSNGPADGSASSSQSGTEAFTKDDVVAAIGSLSWDGEDVSCRASDIRVVLKADAGIWVEQAPASGQAAASSQSVVDLTARRLAALCAWVRQNGVEAPRVTWIAEDGNGYIRMIVCADPQTMDAEGSTSDLLDATEAYAICYDDYTSAVRGEGIAQTKGDTPTYPDGNRASVATSEGQSREQERQEEQAQSSSKNDGGESSSGNPNQGSDAGSDSDSKAGSSADGSSPGHGEGTSVPSETDSPQDATGDSGQAPAATVAVSINGSAAGGSTHGASVGFHDGMTVYDALVAADGDINARDTIYGTYVAAIDGLAEKQHGGMSGWVYAVNGVEPNTACSNYTLSAGDTVVWTYVNVED